MVLRISYFVHGTTQDNIYHLDSGHNDIELAPIGISQAKELGVARPFEFDALFTSDLRRAIDTAKLAWPGRKICSDARLRECDYGSLTQVKKTWDIRDFVEVAYPGGERYRDVESRVHRFLGDVKCKFDGGHVAFVAHQGPQLALEVLTNGLSWAQAIEHDWRNTKSWQPGWEYRY